MIKRALAFSIKIDGKEVSSGFCGVSAKPDGTLPTEGEISKQLLRAAIDKGHVKPEQGTIAAIDLMWVEDESVIDPFRGVMELALSLCPEIVERFGPRSRVEDTQGTAPKKPYDEAEFLRGCGITLGETN